MIHAKCSGTISPPCVFIATLQHPTEENNFKILNFMMIHSRCEDVWSHDVEKTLLETQL